MRQWCLKALKGTLGFVFGWTVLTLLTVLWFTWPSTPREARRPSWLPSTHELRPDDPDRPGVYNGIRPTPAHQAELDATQAQADVERIRDRINAAVQAVGTDAPPDPTPGTWRIFLTTPQEKRPIGYPSQSQQACEVERARIESNNRPLTTGLPPYGIKAPAPLTYTCEQEGAS